LEDVSNNTQILLLAKESYSKLPEIKQRYNLDFDDAYQFQVAEDHKLAIATLDKDFNRVRAELEVVTIP
jgi:predicted nucleic acid-binding protein